MFKYRGKSIESGKWVKGFFCKHQFYKGGLFLPCIQVIKECDSGDYIEHTEIDPLTLGVCWGMKDKNGKDVYTGMFFKGEQLQSIKGQTSCSGTYWVPQLFKICFRKSAFVGINQDEEIQYAGHTFKGGSVIEIPEQLEIVEEE